MAELLTFLAPVASTISTLSKFAILCASFAAVESEVNAYALLLRHHQNTLNSIVTQLPKKQHLLDEGFRAYIENALADSVVSMSMIDSLLGEMVKKVEKKGRVRSVFIFIDNQFGSDVCGDVAGGNDSAGSLRIPKLPKHSKSLWPEFTSRWSESIRVWELLRNPRRSRLRGWSWSGLSSG